MHTMANTAELTESQFNKISDLVKRLCGINLHDGKKDLVKARLSKRLRSLGLQSFEQYMDYIAGAQGPAEISAMLDALSTNLTFFFREGKHFDFLRQSVIPELVRTHQNNRQLRFWSAGCSSGEEPYSIGITLAEEIGDLPRWDVKILATDLSTRVLSAARRGQYTPERFRETPPRIVQEFFNIAGVQPHRVHEVKDSIKRLVHFARLNLMERWPMRGPFDVIFCRNVMIYFDKATQGQLVDRFWSLLAPGGVLFIGHSESLTGVQHKFRYVEPTVYRKA